MLVELKSEHIYQPTCGSTCTHLHKSKHVAEDPKAHFPMEGQFCCDWSCTMKPRGIWLPMQLLLDLHNWLATCCNVLRHLVQIPDWQRNGLMPFPCTQKHRSWNAKQHNYSTDQKMLSLSRCCWHDLLLSEGIASVTILHVAFLFMTNTHRCDLQLPLRAM